MKLVKLMKMISGMRLTLPTKRCREGCPETKTCNMKKSLDLLDQIIEIAERRDLENKKQMIREHKSSKAVGESWDLHHLKLLKELIILEDANVKSGDNRPIQEKE